MSKGQVYRTGPNNHEDILKGYISNQEKAYKEFIETPDKFVDNYIKREEELNIAYSKVEVEKTIHNLSRSSEHLNHYDSLAKEIDQDTSLKA